jgi:hypothetical protein
VCGWYAPAALWEKNRLLFLLAFKRKRIQGILMFGPLIAAGA